MRTEKCPTDSEPEGQKKVGSPATGGAIQLLSTIESLSGFSNRWEQGEELGTKRIGNGAALQMNSRCMSSCSR
jgi:hypothetical protein